MTSWHERLWPPDGWRERIVFEDEALLAIDKPAGLDGVALRQRLMHTLNTRVWLPHTLDSAISGVVLFAKTKEASSALAQQLQKGVATTHRAVVDDGRDRRLVSKHSDAAAPRFRKRLARELVGDAHPAHRVMLHLESVRLVSPSSGEAVVVTAPVPQALMRAARGDHVLPTTIEPIVERLREAAQKRHDLARGDSDSFRVVNSGGDELPGVEVDRYGDYAVVGLRTEEAIALREPILDAVASLGFAGVYLKIRQKHASVLVDTRDDAFAPQMPVRGDAAPAPLCIREEGLELLVNLGDGLSTGVFLDQRDARSWLRQRGACSVLNLFAYHGAFTVAAIAGGATDTVTVDASRMALAHARTNLERLNVDFERHALVKADVFRWLEGAAKRRRQFDVVVLDPPSFSTTKRTTFRADRDYEDLAARALTCVTPGGVLLACTNHRGITPRKMDRVLRQAASVAQVVGATVAPLPAPIDFPPEPGQSHHLKRFVVEVAS